MTLTEFNNQFDIQFNSIAGFSAPNLDAYEKSVYLTKAQLEIIKNYFNPKGNKYNEGFESSEKRRQDLEDLIKSYSTDESFTTSANIVNISKFIEIPNDVFLIVYENIKLEKECYKDYIVNVKPVTHDEFNKQIRNPFKNPTITNAWRLNFSNIENKKVVEIVTPENEFTYTMRYVKYPKPIILENLEELFPGENITINGVSTSSDCELNAQTCEEILDRAVQLALRDYKPQNLESKVQLDMRNE
jgi:hypothetical protein